MATAGLFLVVSLIAGGGLAAPGTGLPFAVEATLVPDEGGAWGRLGNAVDVDGDVIVAGASELSPPNFFAGAVHFYRREATSWEHEGNFRAPSPRAWDYFGREVAVSGTHAAVAALDSGGTRGHAPGAVYAYEYRDGAWARVQKIVDLDREPVAGFGQSIDIEGDRLFVGAPYKDTAAADAGWVQVYEWSGEAWVHAHTLESPAPQSGGKFGYSVSASADRVLVGAPDEYPAAGYVFQLDEGQWTLEAALTRHTSAFNPAYSFGGSVGIDGSVLFLSQASHDRVHLYHHDGNGWAKEAQIANVPAGGRAAAIADGMLAVGWHLEFGDDSGAVHLYARDGGWQHVGRVANWQRADGLWMGAAVAMDDGLIAVGAPGDSTTGARAGAVIVLGRDTDRDRLSDWSETDVHGSDPLHWDTDGDGLSDGGEVFVHATQPLDPDSDGDLYGDGTEVLEGSDPRNPFDSPLTRQAGQEPLDSPLEELPGTDALPPLQ